MIKEIMNTKRYSLPLLVVGFIAIAMMTGTKAEEPNTDDILSQQDAERLFALKVAPLFKEKCLGCHGEKPDDLKGDFDIRSLAGLLKGGESGEASLAPGKPEEIDKCRAAILEGLGPEGTDIDEVIRWCGMPASTVLAAILELEIAGRLTRHHGNRICLVVIR